LRVSLGQDSDLLRFGFGRADILRDEFLLTLLAVALRKLGLG